MGRWSALVTGAAGGLGLVLCAGAFADEGCRAMLADLEVKPCRRPPPRLLGVPRGVVDVTDPADVAGSWTRP